MKKTIYKILALVLISLNANCQVSQIVPLRTPSYEMNNGAYAKDIDNEFIFWLGTWEGISNNKKYTFTFIKFAQNYRSYPSGRYEYKDEVVGKLKVTNLNNNIIIYDESSNINYEDYIINGNVIVGDEFYFGLYDKENHCYNSADFTLVKDSTNPNQIIYKDFSYDEYNYLDCTNYQNQNDIPMFLPMVDLVLTRQ
ncbi:hypothetical protein FLGE108171_15880 [Flavobacterium gelidilacus]|uniref:hypothetical protein n=1 Tax=Flavobacterium gelidilacus TaxID=206041 RepID=UPI00047C7DA0|nr:hypothetical protein [Flavobacterium gelidilacus]